MPDDECDVKRCQPDGHHAASAEVVLDPDDGIAGDTKWLWRNPSEDCESLTVGTVVGFIISGVALHFKIPEGYTLTLMLITTLASYLILRKNYGWATVGFTTAVYTLQLLWLNGEQYILPRLIDTIIGCLIAFGGTVWLWPQWQSGLLRKNAHDALEAYQEAIRLILREDPQPTPLAWQRMRVNQAHNTLYNSLNQAMQEPAF